MQVYKHRDHPVGRNTAAGKRYDMPGFIKILYYKPHQFLKHTEKPGRFVLKGRILYPPEKSQFLYKPVPALRRIVNKKLLRRFSLVIG